MGTTYLQHVRSSRITVEKQHTVTMALRIGMLLILTYVVGKGLPVKWDVIKCLPISFTSKVNNVMAFP